MHWAPTVIHPQLAAGQRLALRTEQARPAPVVDRAGAPVMEPTAVVSVLLDRLATGDLPAVAGALAGALSPIDPQITQASIIDGAARTPDGQAYTVAVLRDTDYQGVKSAIYDLPGVRFTTAERLLAPDAGFARSVLPAVRTEMADQLDGVAGLVGAGRGPGRRRHRHPGRGGAEAGQHGRRRAGPRACRPRPRTPWNRCPSRPCWSRWRRPPGTCVAVAQNGPADAVGAPALAGRYPPGSTFKIATAAAAVAEQQLTADSPVDCPGSTVIGGRPVPNADRFDLGTVPLRTAFARSCNTTFAQLGSRLGPDSLPAAALRLGLGADYAMPALTTITGSVPAAPDLVQRAENGFGQGQVLASPLGMALVAATVARGAPVVPQLIRDRPTEVLRPADRPGPGRARPAAPDDAGRGHRGHRDPARRARRGVRQDRHRGVHRRRAGARLVRRLPWGSWRSRCWSWTAARRRSRSRWPPGSWGRARLRTSRSDLIGSAGGRHRTAAPSACPGPYP